MKKQIIVQKFDGGMTTNPRESTYRSVLCKHFDNFTRPNSLIPYKDSEDVYVSQDTFQGQNFLMYGGNMYIFGRQTANARPALLKNTNIGSPSLSTPTNADTAADAVSDYSLFAEYKGAIYGSDNDGLWSYTGTTWADDALALTYTSITQAMIHSKNDVFVFGYTNSTGAFIATKDGAGAFNATALTLPTNLKVESICEYGKYLAILCSPVTTGGYSKVFLWDMVSADVSETYDVGNKTGKVIEVVEDELVVISYSVTYSSAFPAKVFFSRFTGNGFKDFLELAITHGTAPVLNTKQKYNSRLYFVINGTSVGGTTYDWTGVWSLGKNQDGEFGVVFSYAPDNDTLPQQIKGFIIVNDIAYITYLDAGTGTYGMSKTNDQNVYTTTSILETLKYSGGDINKKKRLVGVAVSKASTTGQLVLKYKTETDSSFVTMHTMATGTAVSQELISIVATGKNLPEFHEIQFRIESTGGAEITGFKFVYEEKDTLLNLK